jgi:hypothetical protein
MNKNGKTGSKNVTAKPTKKSTPKDDGSDQEEAPQKQQTKKASNESNETSGTTSTTVIYKCGQIDYNNVDVSPLNKKGTQPLSYINYNDPNLNSEQKIIIQTGKFQITQGGIPSYHKKYYPTDQSREFLRVPLDDQPATVALRAELEKADEFFGSDELKKKIFGQNADKYMYQPLIRPPGEKDADDDEDEKPKKNASSHPPIEKVDSCKMKLNIIPDGELRVNKTKLKRVSETKNGIKKETVVAKTLTEVANEVKFLSQVKLIFYFSKVWANKTATNGAKHKMYGVGLKILAIEYSATANRGINTDALEFMSEEEDEEGAPVKSNKSGKTTKPVAKKGKNAKLDDDEDDEDNDEEADAPPAKGSKGKTPAAKGKNNTSTEEEDIDLDEESPSKKSKGKTAPKKGAKKSADDDEEDEEDEDEDIPVSKGSKGSKGKTAPKKDTKKAGKGKTAKDESEGEDEDDEDEEEDEEIKPKKKPAKGKAANKGK